MLGVHLVNYLGVRKRGQKTEELHQEIIDLDSCSSSSPSSSVLSTRGYSLANEQI